MLPSFGQSVRAITSCCICQSINMLSFTAEASAFCASRFKSTGNKSTQENQFTSRERLSSKHCFNDTNLFPWKSKEEFSNSIYSGIVYNEGGLIAINKPYGVSIYNQVHSEGVKKDITQTLTYIEQSESPYTVEDALPSLKMKLNVKDITILKSAEKYSSGIVLLATSSDALNKVKTAMLRAKPKCQPYLLHTIITKGYPSKPTLKEYVGIHLMDIGIKDEKQPVIIKDFSRMALKKKGIKPVHVEYRTISLNQKLSCSLLEVSVTSSKWHFIRVYAASKASCILGDTLYSSRVREILGQSININPQNFIAQDIQSLPNQVSQKLMIPLGAKGHGMVPVMIHRHSVILPQYTKGKDLVIIASPPYHFQWTSSQLGLVHKTEPLIV